MIRKAFMITLLSVLVMYLAWNFYSTAIKYDPLASAGSVQKDERAFGLTALPKYVKAWSKDIHAKNLFSPSRTYLEPRPFPQVTVPFIPPPQRPQLVLKGIVLDTFGDFTGLIEVNQARAVPMRKGDKVEDVELIDISSRQVVLKWNAERIILSLDKTRTINNPGMPK